MTYYHGGIYNYETILDVQAFRYLFHNQFQLDNI